jgi:probable rRNA maturation factor
MNVADGSIRIVVLNRQRGVKFDHGWVRRFAEGAFFRCAGLFPKDGRAQGYLRLEEVVVTVVSDGRIDRMHREFMGIPGATDVITFEHGDVVVSADTALREADAHGHRVEAELGLYIVHGLLHLNGFDDLSPGPRTEMHRVQDVVWRELIEGLGG